MSNVSFIRPELSVLLPLYTLIKDAIEGEVTIKKKTTLYLPKPNAEDKSPSNDARYNAYVARAVYYNVTRRTLLGLLGQVFARESKIVIPDKMQIIEDNSNGAGLSLNQLARQALAYNLAYSRAGIFVDFPQTESGATVAQIDSGEIRPTIYAYEPQHIVNWRVVDRGANEILSLVVLMELFIIEDDGFEMKHGCQFRVLKLDEETGNYIQEIWREPNPTEYNQNVKAGKRNFQMFDTLQMLGFDGNPLKEIPFRFIGSENNDSNADNPNFYDLASVNLAHFRNSADYEEACFIVGQPTVVMTGLTKEWVNEVLKGTVAFGSRGGLPLPVGGDAKLLQAAENTMLKEAMDAKERQMTALGAKLVEQTRVQRTAYEASLESSNETSVLASCVDNTSEAIEWALTKCAELMGLPTDSIEFELNNDFDIAKLDPVERAQCMKEWQAGGITFEEYRATLRKAKVATEDDEEAKTKIASEMTSQLALAMPPNQPGAGAFKKPAPAPGGAK